MTSLRRNVDSWLKEHNIRAFFSVTQDESFSVGAKSCMNLVGLGMKISHTIKNYIIMSIVVTFLLIMII